jgi:aminomethyltransferase
MLKNIFRLTKKTFSEKEQVKRTALYSFHKDNLKAKMVPFAGHDMPVQYFGIIEEHNHCRENSSIFDVSHMGQVR